MDNLSLRQIQDYWKFLFYLSDLIFVLGKDEEFPEAFLSRKLISIVGFVTGNWQWFLVDYVKMTRDDLLTKCTMSSCRLAKH